MEANLHLCVGAITETVGGAAKFSVDLTGVTTTQPAFLFTPATVGVYAVSVTVTSSSGGIGNPSAPLTLNVGASGPGILIAGAHALVTANTAVSLSSDFTQDPGITVASYAWSVTLNHLPFTLPPGTPTDQSSFMFTPAANGPYAVNLTVTDTAGKVSSTTVDFIVTGGSPSVQIVGAPTQSTVGMPITLAAGVTDFGSSTPLSYDWSVIENSAVVASATADTTGVFTFTPPTAGSYQVTLAVHGSSVAPAAATIDVGAAAPTVAITLDSPAATAVTVGTPVVLTGTGTLPGSSTAPTLSWSVFSSGRGQVVATGTGSSFTYRPSATGVDLVTLTATAGSQSRSTTLALDVIAEQGAAVVGLTLVGTPQVESTTTVNAAVTGAPSGVTYTYAWTVSGEAVPFSATLPAGSPAS